MGGAASGLAGAAGIEKTSDKARLSRELSDKILTLFFKNADFKDLLSLSSITACPQYVFTTAEALTSLFQKIKVYPELGPKGEVLYAPIDRVSPGLIKDSAAAKREGSQNTLERTKFRNQMCMDVAYFYVRTFQIYAALALTVLNTDPVRRRLQQPGPGIGPGHGSKPGQFQSGTFVGGAIAATNPIYRQLRDSNFAPFIGLFDNKGGNDRSLKMKDKTKQIGEFFVEWVNNPKAQSMSLESFYKIQGVPKTLDVQVRMDQTAPNEITMYLNDTKIQVFRTFRLSNEWLFFNESTETEKVLSDSAEFTAKVHEYFGQYAYNKGAVTKGRPAGTAYGVTASQGKTSFDGFDAVKKLYDDRYQGKEFPKAYCVARAMILMNPIFQGELSDPRRPYYTDICKSTLDFELAGELMPRPGRQPKANVYFKSLVGLYYDEYVVKGDDVVFTKSPASAEALKRGSALLARLHNITTAPESFIESGTEFKGSSLCKTKDDFIYKQTPEGEQLRQAVLKEVINPLLAFQEAHNVSVNNFLMKMFIMSVDPKTGEQVMKFSPALKEGGRVSVNNFGRSAAALLLDYYLKSEALYSKGVMMIETNTARMQMIAGKV